jgi:hypothetical protein
MGIGVRLRQGYFANGLKHRTGGPAGRKPERLAREQGGRRERRGLRALCVHERLVMRMSDVLRGRAQVEEDGRGAVQEVCEDQVQVASP